MALQLVLIILDTHFWWNPLRVWEKRPLMQHYCPSPGNNHSYKVTGTEHYYSYPWTWLKTEQKRCYDININSSLFLAASFLVHQKTIWPTWNQNMLLYSLQNSFSFHPKNSFFFFLMHSQISLFLLKFSENCMEKTLPSRALEHLNVLSYSDNTKSQVYEGKLKQNVLAYADYSRCSQFPNKV